MLAFNVAQLLKEGTGATRQRELSGALRDIDEYNPGPVPVEGHVLLVVTPEGVLAMGQAQLALVQACRRCLELTETQVTIEIEETFYPSIDLVTGRLLPDDHDDEPELLIDEHHTLDLTEVLKQYAVAQTLKATYCKPDCQGLCPVCGINRNLETCTCETQQLDPRLAALAQLLESAENQE
jgi:uncharacterized protein